MTDLNYRDVHLGGTMDRHDNNRYQTQQQLRQIKDSQVNKKCNSKGELFYVWLGTGIAGSLAVIGWIANFAFGYSNLLSVERSAWKIGEFGDVFGVTNSLFSGLAFIGVFLSVMLQRKELEAVKAERGDTRAIFRDQQANLKRQRFETTFFQMLSTFNEISASLKESVAIQQYYDPISGSMVQDNNIQREGKAVFDIYLLSLISFYSQYAEKEALKEDKVTDFTFHDRYGKRLFYLEIADRRWKEVPTFLRAYDKLFAAYGADLGRYYRSLYTLLKFVQDATLPAGVDEKKLSERRETFTENESWFYYKLVRAQLSREEVTMLALNSLSRYTTKKFNKIIFEKGLLKNADQSNTILATFGAVLPPKSFGYSYKKANNDPDVHFPFSLNSDEIWFQLRINNISAWIPEENEEP